MSQDAVHHLEDAPPASEDVMAFTGLAETPAAPATPGFSLADDADGRFVIDADTGVISLAHEDLVERERNVVHGVRIRVVERNGDSYEMAVRLKITGLVPKMAGEDYFGEAPDLSSPAPAATAAPAPVETPTAAQEPAAFSAAHWMRYAAFAARQAQHRKRARFAAAQLGAALPIAVLEAVACGAANLDLGEDALIVAADDSYWAELGA